MSFYYRSTHLETKKIRKIIHVDMDCFYAAIEMRDNPQLRKGPIAVGGSEQQRGVISTCNYEARAFGVRSAMPTSQAKRLCPHLILVPHHFEKYREASALIHKIFNRYTTLIEPLSLDEAFLDVTDCEHFGGSATYIARDIRSAINKEVGITASAGIANSKFLAKIASDWNKPNGQKVILPAEVSRFMQSLPINKLHGVGKVTARRLNDLNIFTCADLQKVTLGQLHARFGKFGNRLYELSRGIDEREVMPRDNRHSLSVERTFAEDIAHIGQCDDEATLLIEELKRRFDKHRHQYCVRKIFVKVKFGDFTQTSVERRADFINEKIFHELFNIAYHREHKPIRLIGAGIRLEKKTNKYEQLVLPLRDISNH